MRKQRVVLEHGVDRALERRQVRNLLAVQLYVAAGGMFEARDQAQQCRFAAARRAEQGEEFVFANVDRNLVERKECIGALTKLSCSPDLPRSLPDQPFCRGLVVSYSDGNYTCGASSRQAEMHARESVDADNRWSAVKAGPVLASMKSSFLPGHGHRIVRVFWTCHR